VIVQSLLHTQEQQEQQPLTDDLIQACSFSVSPENIVIQFKKACPYEWQALQLHFRTLSQGSTDASSLPSLSPLEKASIGQEANVSSRRESIDESSVLVKFVTVSNMTSFQEAIQSQPLWDRTDASSQDTARQVVGKVQAKRVPGMNAIQMTAELVSASSS
jgi:hypothetical protein